MGIRNRLRIRSVDTLANKIENILRHLFSRSQFSRDFLILRIGNIGSDFIKSTAADNLKSSTFTRSTAIDECSALAGWIGIARSGIIPIIIQLRGLSAGYIGKQQSRQAQT